MAEQQQAQTGAENGAADQGQQTNAEVQQTDNVQGAEKTVPIAAMQDERSKRQAAEAEVKRLKDENYLYRMNTIHNPGVSGANNPMTPQPGPQGAPTTTPDTPATLAIPEELARMNEDEIMTAGELRKVLQSTRLPETTGAQGKSDQQQVTVGRQILDFVRPDAEQVLNGAFVERANKEPYLVNFVSGLPPLLRPFVAYRLGKGDSPGQAQQTAVTDATAAGMGAHAENATPPAAGNAPNDTVNKVLANAQKPQPTSAIANAGAIDSSKRYANMTEEELDAEIERVKNL